MRDMFELTIVSDKNKSKRVRSQFNDTSLSIYFLDLCALYYTHNNIRIKVFVMGATKEKTRVNLYVSRSLSEDAKRLGINMSKSLESALKIDIAKKWQQQNQLKIDLYNSHIESGNLPFDDDDLAI